jgi:hypothetical protein
MTDRIVDADLNSTITEAEDFRASPANRTAATASICSASAANTRCRTMWQASGGQTNRGSNMKTIKQRRAVRARKRQPTETKVNPLDELFDATTARFGAVVALCNAFGDAAVTWDGSANAKQLEDACGREISALARAHMRLLEAEYALTIHANE